MQTTQKPFQESILDAVNNCQNLEVLKALAELIINTEIDISKENKKKIISAFKFKGGGNQLNWSLDSLFFKLEECLGL